MARRRARNCPAWSANTSRCWPRPARATTSRFRRELHRHHLLHHRHHRQSERCVFQPPATGPAHPGDGFDHRQPGQHPPARYQRRVHADHPDVPCPRLGHSVRGDHARGQAGLSRALRSGTAGRTVEAREGHLLPLRADHPADGDERQGRPGPGLQGLEGDHRRERAEPLALRGGQGARHPADRRLRHVGDLSADFLRLPQRRTAGRKRGRAHHLPDQGRRAGAVGGRGDHGRTGPLPPGRRRVPGRAWCCARHG